MIRIMLIFLLFCVSCAKWDTMNLKKHYYGTIPSKIVWLQVAGLTEEHFAMLRFALASADKKLSFEQVSCVGKMWGFNLYKMRPTPSKGFFSQIVGSKNIKGKCSDYSYEPLWKNLIESGYSTGIFLTNSGIDETFLGLDTCQKESKNFLGQTTSWIMSKRKNSTDLQFHQQEQNIGSAGVYYDKSCQQGVCFNSKTSNIISVYDRFTAKKKRFLFIIQDLSFYEMLEKKNISKARTILGELEGIFKYFINLSTGDSDMLVMLTSTSPKGIEYPEVGKNWLEYEKKGINIGYKRDLLLGTVLVRGAGSENFCGIYNQSEIKHRILFSTRTNLIMN